jgi:hypothetical protein
MFVLVISISDIAGGTNKGGDFPIQIGNQTIGEQTNGSFWWIEKEIEKSGC